MLSLNIGPFEAVFLIHAILFVIALIPIVSSRIYSRGQKWAQVTFALLIPIVGPGVVIAVAISDRLKTDKISDRMMGQSINEHISKYRGHR